MQYSNSLNKFTSLKNMKLKIIKKIEKNKWIIRSHRLGSKGNESFRKMLERHLKHEQRLKIVCFRYSAYW